MTEGTGGPDEGTDTRQAAAGRGRGRWVLILLLFSGLVALTALPVWVTAAGTSPLADEVTVSIRGTAAAPGLVAAALVLLAAAAAVGLVGRVGRWVVVVVVVAAGGLVVGSGLGGRSGADATAKRAAADATGVSSLTGPPQVAVWPLAAVAVGVLIVAVAVGLARASGRWAAPTSRHDRPGAGSVDSVDTPAVGAAPGARPRSSGRAEPRGGTVGRGGSTDPTGMRTPADSVGAGHDAGSDPARRDTGAVRPIGTGPSATGNPDGPSVPAGLDTLSTPAGLGALSTPDGLGVPGTPSGSDVPSLPAGPPALAAPDERATWDALTRGDDPT